MSNFAVELRAQLEADPKLSRRGKRILEILKSRPSRIKTRRLERMERHALAALEVGDLPSSPTPQAMEVGAIDWSTIDWSAVIGKILDVLLKLLPLLLAL